MTSDQPVATAPGLSFPRRHPAPLAAGVCLLVLGMNYSLWWYQLRGGGAGTWLAPSDLWGTYLAAVQLLVGTPGAGVAGHFSSPYAATPGALILLAPVAALGHALNLEVGPNWAAFSAPTGWEVVGPYILVLSWVPLLAADVVAERLGASGRARWVLATVGAVTVANVSLKWGHPEWAVALGLAVLATVDASDRRWRRCGWLASAALTVQPMAVMVLPALLAAAWVTGRRQLPALVLRIAALPVVLLVPAIVFNRHDTLSWLANQGNFPAFNHPTPFTGLARSLGPHSKGEVAAGPERAVALVAAALVSVTTVVRTRARALLPVMLWAFALSLGLWIAFESVIDSYYVWPVPALAMMLVAARPGRWLAALCAGSLFAMWFANSSYGGIDGWWAVMVAVLAASLALSWPPARAATPSERRGRGWDRGISPGGTEASLEPDVQAEGALR